MSTVTLHLDPKHPVKGETELPVRKCPALSVRPVRRAGVGHAGIRRATQLELLREGWGTHVGRHSLRPKTGPPPFFFPTDARLLTLIT